MPERVYNLSYAPATQTLLVSMSHRHVYVYSLRELSAAGEDLKPQSSRESALKFLTRSVACMADGKGRSFVSLLIGTGEEVEVSESVLIDRMGVWVY
jgi:cell cycle arrest protein BUB3